ncbi:CAT RNA binding domain-containing protein, partial [Halalkalibacterium ligniniphilum]
MHDPYIVVKILNNNVVVAQEQGKNEVILIGKGIGFGKKKGAHIDAEDVDKLFVLANEHQQEEYKRLLDEIDEELIALIEEAVTYIQTALKQRLDERIHVALTDHIGFAVRRMKQGIDIQNPFLLETEAMFPSEYALAKEVVSLMNNHLDIP